MPLGATGLVADPSDLALVARVAVAGGIGFLVGFERNLRGAPAGDRTYSLVALGTAAITAVTFRSSPQAVAGAVTGIGFIGAGLVIQSRDGMVRGVTSAAAIYAIAAIGVVAGYGHLALAAIVGGAVLLSLELTHIPVLRVLDARRYAVRFRADTDPPRGMGDADPREGGTGDAGTGDAGTGDAGTGNLPHTP